MLTKAGQKVGSLIQKGIRAAGTYGIQTVGLDIREIDGLRSAYHAALDARGKSSTMEFALAAITDPATDAHEQVAYTWASAWREEWLPRKMLSKIFDSAVASFNPQALWRSLLGPGEVTVATLMRLMWRPLSADKWRTADELDIDLSSVAPLSVKKLVAHDAQRWAWDRASQNHSHMRSLSHVPFLQPLKSLLKKALPDKNWHAEQRAILHSLLAGAYMFEQLCPLCGVLSTDIPGRHFFWECACTRPFRESFGLSDELALAAGADKGNSFYVSALLSHPFGRAPLPTLELCVDWKVVTGDGPLFVGEAFGDGASAQGPDPMFIRCAWAVVSLAGSGANAVVKTAASGNLPGPHQTVPGAEAFALLFFLWHALPDQSGKLVYYTDNKWVFDSWKLPAFVTAAASAPHSDIWEQIHRAANDIGIDNIYVEKVKSHRSIATAVDDADAFRIKGNQMADIHAKAALCKHALVPEGADLQKKAATTVDVIARFLVHILSCYHKRFGSFPKHQTSTTQPALTVCGTRCRSTPHYALRASGDARWRCGSCFASSTSAEALSAQPCPAPKGNGHTMRSLPDLVYCDRCGAFSASAVRHLLDPCVQCKPGTARHRSLCRLRRGLHPYKLTHLGTPSFFEPSELRWCRL